MYKLIAIAGTFDRLHKGHRYFISEAFKLGEKVIIGLTSDDYVSKFKILNSKFEFKLKISNFKLRKKELEGFLKNDGLFNRTKIVKIEDIYGPAIERNEIEALVVTQETMEGATMVNRKREELGLKPLEIIKIPLILAEDEKRIASTRIRWGEIDRWGRVFSKIFNFQFSISNELRSELKKPMGKLIGGNPKDLKIAAEKVKRAIAKTNSPMIITVGDEVTKLCNEIGIAVSLAIFDYKVSRKKKYSSLVDLGFQKNHTNLHGRINLYGLWVKVNNPPGHITKELVDAVKDAYKGIIKDGNQRIIQVDGEEDLAGVPAVLLAPLGSLVLYGQPGEGVVMVEVTEEKKKKLLDFLDLYSHIS